jgi:hypothetical protein
MSSTLFTASRETLPFRAIVAVLLLMIAGTLVAGCNRSSSPTAPSTGLALNGAVTDTNASAPVPNARVEVTDGANQGKSATADATGRYDLADLQPGVFSVRAQADGFEATAQSVTLTDSSTVNFSLRRQPRDDPEPTIKFSVTGTVKDARTQAAIANARVEIVDGANVGKATTADSAGRYALTSLSSGTFVLRGFADGYDFNQRSVTVGPSQTIDFSLAPKIIPPSDPSGPVAKGRTVDALSNRPLPGMNVRIDGLGEATTGSDGGFSIAGAGQEQSRIVTVSSVTTVERQTHIRVPSDVPTLTLIPQDINLGAFDQMFRSDDGGLHRWVAAPRLVVERRVLTYTGQGDDTYVATAELMSEADAQALISDLVWALPQLTGGTFGAFAEVVSETPQEGDVVRVTRPGSIVVARYKGLTTATSYWGYSRWAWNGAGETIAGVMMLDADFETSASAFHRSLHAHELGHALGYNHVSARESVMDSSGRVEPNAFDRDGSKIAFMRTPLNQSPDIDPDPTTPSSLRTGQIRWKGAH